MAHKKYLDREDLADLRKQQDFIKQQKFIVIALELAKGTWLRNHYNKYKMDHVEKYDVNCETGRIVLIKKDAKDRPRKG